MRNFIAAFVLAAALFGCGRSDPIVVIQLHPKNPDIIYVATNDYIYKTRDGGQTWTNLSKGMSYSRVIAMAIDPVYPATIYAGTKGDAVYKSHDGGQRWVSMRSGLDDATITSVVNQFLFDPADAQHIFLATTMGVFETKNGGEQWTDISQKEVPAFFGFAVALDEKDDQTAWVVPAVSDEYRVAVNEALCVSRTEDGGKTWTALRNGLPQQDCFDLVYRHALDISGDRLAFGTTTGNLFISDDRGDHWECVNHHLPPVFSVRFG